MKYLFLYLLFSTNTLNLESHKNNPLETEYTSIKNLPIIMKNERIANDRCRLHLDSGEKVEIACVHELYDS